MEALESTALRRPRQQERWPVPVLLPANLKANTLAKYPVNPDNALSNLDAQESLSEQKSLAVYWWQSGHGLHVFILWDCKTLHLQTAITSFTFTCCHRWGRSFVGPSSRIHLLYCPSTRVLLQQSLWLRPTNQMRRQRKQPPPGCMEGGQVPSRLCTRHQDFATNIRIQLRHTCFTL